MKEQPLRQAEWPSGHSLKGHRSEMRRRAPILSLSSLPDSVCITLTFAPYIVMVDEM